MQLSCDMMSQPEMNSQIALPDGRTLSYMQAGADAGPVVTVLDGPCSRGLGRALAPTARELGIRLLIPDRPGIHGSAAKPGRTMADWPADQLALLDALGIERTGVVTQSGGTGYGIAVAASAPQRLTGLALLGALAPMTSRDARMDAGESETHWATVVARAFEAGPDGLEFIAFASHDDADGEPVDDRWVL
jgi:pimeloyl-ACP methyl ester carboxylesterase